MNTCLKPSLAFVVLVIVAFALMRMPTAQSVYAADPQYDSSNGDDNDACTSPTAACASNNGTRTVAFPAHATARLQTDFGSMPLYFIANQGQLDRRVAFYIQASDKTLYFAPDGVTFALTVPGLDSSPEKSKEQARSRWIVKLDFVDANSVQPIGQAQTDATISYFKGARDEWHTGLPTFSKIVYPDLWEGIDLVYSGTVNRLKYEFVVKPGADPTHIQLAYRGATVRMNDAGQLEVNTSSGGFQDDAPVAYQEVAGQRVPVNVGFAMNDTATSSADDSGMEMSHPYGLHVGAYNPALPLVIDPAVLVYAGYIGGSGPDYGNGIAVDPTGNAYVTGYTTSTEASFPVTVGPDLTHNVSYDTFVAKVKADGTALVYAGYIGGSGEDRGQGIAVDAAGNAYVTGYTTSTEASFPVTVGPDLTHNGYGYDSDAFVAKVFNLPFTTVSKSVDKTIVSLGDSLSYTIAFTMSNDIPPTTVLVTDVLPSHLSYIPDTLSASSGSYSYSGGVITWNGTVNANTPVNITFRTTVSSPGLYITNSATIDAGWLVTRTATVQGGSICNLAKHPSNPVLGVGPSGAWDSVLVWDPTVLKEDGIYKMWFTGRNASNNQQIGYATSLDGITWTKHGSNPVLSPSLTWEGARVSYPSVINDGGTYKMWYAGRDSSGITRIGYATSPDGITWTKYSSNPVLNVGPAGTWDDTYIAYPSVTKVGSTFHMWYDGYDGVTSRIGHAISPDGIHWTKDAANPALNVASPGSWDWIHVYGPSVMSYDDAYILWYSGETLPASAQTGYAISSDGTDVLPRQGVES